LTDVYLVRHGATASNERRILQGSATDEGLSDLGRRQAAVLADRLRPVRPEVIITSDLARAYETATVIADVAGLLPVIDRRLRERDFGPFEGLGRSELALRRREAGLDGPDLTGDWTDADGVEPHIGFQARIIDALQSAVCHKEITGDGPLVLVSHGGVIRGIYHYFRRLREDHPHALNVRNASFLRVGVKPEENHFELLELWRTTEDIAR